MTYDTHQAHRSRIEEILFVGPAGATPWWLKQQASSCSARYAGFRLIPEFRAALSAFSDVGFKPFELFVVGEGKFGKSTLVNALLGEIRSKARGLPETRCFLRYVITDQPRKNARLFLRLQAGLHDWLATRVGKGTPVPELFEVLQYEVDGEQARDILEGESKRLDSKNYVPAVFEAERDHQRTSRSMFPAGVRIVDTQGLDQLFPSDLQQLGRAREDAAITARFMDWLSQTPRGKHLEWQFRRCDAVLWCVNAKRIGSAATEAAMRYFAAYCKKIVIALTNVDLVARKPGDLEKLLDAARRKYAGFSATVIAVNGQKGLDARLSDDAEGMQASGLTALAEELMRVCVAEGTKTRAVSRYLGLRKTETQFRRALEELSGDLAAVESKFDDDREALREDHERAEAELFQWLDSLVAAECNSVRARIWDKVSLGDNESEAVQHSGVGQMVVNLESAVGERLRSKHVARVRGFVDRISPYQLPQFDADGQKAGDRIRVQLEIETPHVPPIELIFRLRFDKGILDQLSDYMTRALAWLGDASSKDKLSKRNEKLREDVWKAFVEQWERCARDWAENLRECVEQIYVPVAFELARVMERVESIESESVAATRIRIENALQDRGAKVAIHERLSAGFRSSGEIALGCNG